MDGTFLEEGDSINSRGVREFVDVCSFDDSMDSSRGVKLSLRGIQVIGEEED